MRITTLVALLVIIIGLSLATSSRAFLEIWRYYPEGDLVTSTWLWNLPADDDYYVQAYDPADFGVGSPYTIVEVGINTYGDGIEGSGSFGLHLILLPTKDTSPDGIPYTYDLTGQTLTWADGEHTLNTYTVDWDVTGGQCVGLVVLGEDPYIEDFIIPMDNGPSDTADWEYYIDEWLDLEEDEGIDRDFGFQLTVDYTDTSITPASFGQIKAGFH
jgi:hypothetical protein